VPEFEKRWSRYARPVGDSWRADETYLKIKGQWVYLYRAVDKEGRTVDFLLSKRRDVAAAKRFFSRATNQHGVPRVVRRKVIWFWHAFGASERDGLTWLLAWNRGKYIEWQGVIAGSSLFNTVPCGDWQSQLDDQGRRQPGSGQLPRLQSAIDSPPQ
jgi:hypothetical protein